MNNTEHFQAEVIATTDNVFSLIEKIENPNLQKKLLDRISALAELAATTVRGSFKKILSGIIQLEADAHYAIYEQREAFELDGAPSFAYHNNPVENDGHYGFKTN